MNKKGMAMLGGGSMGLEVLVGAVIVLVLIGIVAVFGLDLLTDQQNQFVTNTLGCNATSKISCGIEYNATNDAIQGVAKIPSKLPLLGGAVITVVIIGLLVFWFMRK
jgi:hypothetical protein